MIVELGANDALRGIDPDVTRAALSDILTRLKARKIAVLLCGMVAPPNYGGDYAARFNAIYPDLAKSSACRCIRFFWMASRPTPSSTRPTACIRPPKGSTSIVKNMLPTVEAFLGTISGHAVEKRAAITLTRSFPGSVNGSDASQCYITTIKIVSVIRRRIC